MTHSTVVLMPETPRPAETSRFMKPLLPQPEPHEFWIVQKPDDMTYEQFVTDSQKQQSSEWMGTRSPRPWGDSNSSPPCLGVQSALSQGSQSSQFQTDVVVQTVSNSPAVCATRVTAWFMLVEQSSDSDRMPLLYQRKQSLPPSIATVMGPLRS